MIMATDDKRYTAWVGTQKQFEEMYAFCESYLVALYGQTEGLKRIEKLTVIEALKIWRGNRTIH